MMMSELMICRHLPGRRRHARAIIFIAVIAASALSMPAGRPVSAVAHARGRKMRRRISRPISPCSPPHARTGYSARPCSPLASMPKRRIASAVNLPPESVPAGLRAGFAMIFARCRQAWPILRALGAPIDAARLMPRALRMKFLVAQYSYC